jgi:hypothetical protein
MHQDKGLLSAGALDETIFPLDAFVPIVNAEACRNTVSEGFGASADIIVIKEAIAEGDDRNDDNQAAFAATLNFRALAQWRYRIWFSLGTGQSTRKIAVAREEGFGRIGELGFELLTGHAI